MNIRAYTNADLPQMTAIWNEVVAEGVAFPQDEPLTSETAAAFFASQSYTAVAEVDGCICGLYILHPNNVGRCGHICNASYAVGSAYRDKGIGAALVRDCMVQGKLHGFRVLQFNAVAADNLRALHLYQKLGFTQLGVIPEGFRRDDGSYQAIIPHYVLL